jgi:predicted dehydrogenase
LNKRILLVGCGNIGSRHLQALVKLPFKTDIEIVEPNENAKNIAKSRLKEIEFNNSNFTLEWHSDIINTSASDVVILATLATNRVELVEKLLNMGNSRFLLEKIVCQSDDEYDKLLSMMNNKNIKAWVNTPRRYFESYRKIERLIEKNSQINLTVNSGNMGLGSNAIHFVDLFLWLTKNQVITLNGEYLDKNILTNKRGSSFKEFYGTITGKSENGSVLSINFLNYDELSLCVNIFGKNNNMIINETDGKIFDLNTQKNSKFKIEYQSSLTTKIIIDIFENDSSLLPTITDSKIPHSELFRIFNSHIKKITKKEPEKCPIT